MVNTCIVGTILLHLLFVVTGTVLSNHGNALMRKGPYLLELDAHESSKTSVEWKPVQRGGELHKDVGELMKTETLSPAAHAIFEQVAPEACGCSTDRWDQYVVCQQAAKKSTNAFSLGVNGYDPWGEYVHKNYKLVPNLYDCFNQKKPEFENNFAPVCIGSKEGEIEGRKYETLPRLLTGVGATSTLLKMDIERSEYDVLGSLTASDFDRLSSLNVEYHFNYACPTPEVLQKALHTMTHVRKHLVVVDSAAGYYGDSCIVNGTRFPKIFAVSYAARSLCPSM